MQWARSGKRHPSEYPRQSVAFETKSGRLEVSRAGHGYEMDFPAYGCVPVAWPESPSKYAALAEEVPPPLLPPI